MKSLRIKYNELIEEVSNEFERLINVGDYSFIEFNIKAVYDDEAEEVLNIFNEDGIKVAEQEYNILESFIQIYYNDENGIERMAYLLGAEKENGVYIFDNDTFDTKFIEFESLNGITYQLDVIEEIKNS